MTNKKMSYEELQERLAEVEEVLEETESERDDLQNQVDTFSQTLGEIQELATLEDNDTDDEE